jgi:hypothetical protein
VHEEMLVPFPDNRKMFKMQHSILADDKRRPSNQNYSGKKKKSNLWAQSLT